MSKPWIHAESSARRFGGKPDDYIEIHNLFDASKGTVGDSRHRALTHTTWFLSTILERIFGVTLTNSAGKIVSVRSIGEQHILEDFGGRFIPTVQDYFAGMDFQTWMLCGKGSPPPSSVKTHKGKPMTNLEQLSAAKKKIAEAQKTVTETCRKAFEEGVAPIFEKHPNLEAFGWTQYTPYFNDGDECVFSARTDYLTIAMTGDDFDFHDGEDIGLWNIQQAVKNGRFGEREAAAQDALDLVKQFDDADYKTIFGDHVSVKVSRSGIEVEEYEHE